MEPVQDTSSTLEKKLDNSDSSGEGTGHKPDAKNSEKNADSEDPKPRIVLTFRSERGAKSNMKIVPTEGKSDEVSPRRSSRRHGFIDLKTAMEYAGISPKKFGHHYESEENSDSSHSQTPKRSMRGRSKDFDNVIANAIARKEKSYNETSTLSRPSRRIKPTAKVLANEELRIEMESSRTKASTEHGTEKSPEEGVRTRGSYRKQTVSANEDSSDKTNSKCKVGDESENQKEVMKLKHLCELGLKAKSPEDDQENSNDKDTEEPIEIDDDETPEDEEIDDDTEVISKLLEADDDSSDTSEYFDSGEEELAVKYTPKGKKVAAHRPKRRSTRYENDSDCSLPVSGDNNAPRRRSLRKRIRVFEDNYFQSRTPRSEPREESHCDEDQEEMSDVADGEEGTGADTPPEKNEVIATCCCEASSNMYAAASNLPEPVFCQAVETVDGVRVGCSHLATKQGSSYAPLIRAGLRAPYFLACKLHNAQLRKHMCCPVCGLFCTQGIFYQCSENHLFHIDCALPYNTNKERLGCPHCGVYSYGWQPVNKECCKVKVEMKCSNERILMTDQKEQCTPAYPSFSSLPPARPPSPLIPSNLLPSLPDDVKTLCETETDVSSSQFAEALCEALLAGGSFENIVPKLLRQTLSATDERRAPPLVRAVKALLEKSEKFSSKNDKLDANKEELKEMDVEKSEVEAKSEVEEKEKEGEEVKGNESGTKKPSDEELMKVIRYLVAAGCDVNVPDSEGMTALHVAAQHGSVEVCSILVSAVDAQVDPRDHGGWTPLVWAAENKHPSVVRLLLREGADATAVDSEGNAVIHWCALAGCADSLHMLVTAAPDQLHARNTHADTPLHVAARQGHYACVVILLARGARPDVENSEGQLPADVCSGPCLSAVAFNARMRKVAQGDAPPLRILSNDMSHGSERHPVPCVNDVDEEATPPAEFTYVTSNVTPAPVPIDNTIQSLQGCNCRDGNCSTDSCGCCALSVGAWWVRGRLRTTFPHHQPPALLHCTPLCACNKKKCQNSTVTRLSTTGALFVRAEVFRCGGARGWGLRATQPVLRGTPVALYTGELLKNSEADTRTIDQYMFALDCKPDLIEQYSDKTLLCVDAAKYGSASRFINHSCAANLSPVRVLSGTRDLRAPLVTLFAVRDISVREELTFDYGDKFWSVKAKYMKCECGTPECRYPNIIEETES